MAILLLILSPVLTDLVMSSSLLEQSMTHIGITTSTSSTDKEKKNGSNMKFLVFGLISRQDQLKLTCMLTSGQTWHGMFKLSKLSYQGEDILDKKESIREFITKNWGLGCLSLYLFEQQQDEDQEAKVSSKLILPRPNQTTLAYNWKTPQVFKLQVRTNASSQFITHRTQF